MSERPTPEDLAAIRMLMEAGDYIDVGPLDTLFAEIDALTHQVQMLRESAIALLLAVDDAFETPAEAASWALTGDMQGYLDALQQSLDATKPEAKHEAV